MSSSNERISVKTVTTSSHVSFNALTFEYVDRVIVLRVNVDDELGLSVEDLRDETAEVAKGKMRLSDGKYVYTIAQGNQREKRPVENCVSQRARHSELEIVRHESGAIRILRDGAIQPVVVKDVLRPIAAGLGVSLLDPKGETKNTQALGAVVIRALNLRSNHPGA